MKADAPAVPSVGVIDSLVRSSAALMGDRLALTDRQSSLTYAELDQRIDRAAAGFLGLGFALGDRLAIYLPKQVETVVALLGAARAGGIFVPINPVLKPRQVDHILRDSGATFLVTSQARLSALQGVGSLPETMKHCVLVDGDKSAANSSHAVLSWDALLQQAQTTYPTRLEDDLVALLYTSGSTGRPKGVALSHRNLGLGALSVSQYLENTEQDRLLAVLPLSFDYGLNQLTTAFRVGAHAVLHDYLVAADIPRAVARHGITGLAGVPPLWMQLAATQWPDEARSGLRYFTNSGGRMPRPVLDKLRTLFPKAKPYLMYGLTEAFRSTYLDPGEVGSRPDSIGKAIPYAEVLVVRPDGTEAAPHEPGELVHTGPLVAQGYWRDPERTAERFKPAPACARSAAPGSIAVWSGDTVRRDEQGYLYFVARADEMIKTSGYRVSPTEVEEALYASGLVQEAVAIGVADEQLGEAICIYVTAMHAGEHRTDALLDYCRRELPAYMVPSRIHWRDSLPRNANGKLDRAGLTVLVRQGE